MVATVDLVQNENIDNFTTQEYAACKETLENWERFKTVVYTADALGGAATLTQSVVRGITKIESWDHFTTILKKNKNLLKGNAKRIYEAVVKGGNVAGEEWEILKFALQQNKKYLIKGGVLTLASVATQFAGNMCYYNGDVNQSIDKVDLFDAIVDGYTMELGMRGNTIYRLFKNSNKAYIYHVGKLFLIEFSKVTVDINLNLDLQIKNYFDTKDQQKAMMLFILNLSTKYTADQISNMLKNWSKIDMATLYATATTEEREMMQTIDKIVNSEKFKPLLDAPINAMNQVVSDIIDKLPLAVEIKKINTKTVTGDFDTIIKKNEKLPDNTRVEILNKYRYENQ